MTVLDRALSDHNTEYDPTDLQSVFESSFTYARAVERNTHRYAKRVAIVEGPTGRRWTYAQLGQVTGGLVAASRHAASAPATSSPTS